MGTLGKHWTLSTERKKQLSDSMVGKYNPNYGKKLTEEHRKKIGESNKGKCKGGWKLSVETRRKMSESKMGDKSNLWKGGITEKNAKIRSSLEYRLWREGVFARDNWTCIWCGSAGVYINADHIKPFAHYPELRFDLDNGRTLCVPCHKKTDSFAKREKIEIL